jgi:hypothetical protein
MYFQPLKGSMEVVTEEKTERLNLFSEPWNELQSSNSGGRKKNKNKNTA